jgi:large subunit ribosomal protein L17
MRHLKHHFQLGVTREHRQALMANLASQLFTYGKIKTTLPKAKALRPFAEKMITLAKHGASADDGAQKLHYRRLAIARVRNRKAVKHLFDDLSSQFLKRNGGYTRIIKLMNRVGDGAPMALIQLVEEPAEKRRRSGKKLQKVNSQSTDDHPVASVDNQEVQPSVRSDSDKEAAPLP